jgi:prenyl protein peptidase
MLKDLYDHLSTIQGLRDLIIGPITEEIIYTASIILILNQVQDISAKTLIYLPPVFFSFAHFHHAYELYTHGSIPLKVILISSTFQLAYTFLFGIFTNYLFLRTRNVWSCFVVHFFCNFMGFPKIGGFANKLWRVVYFGLLIVGIWLFKSNLQQLTESPLRLVVDL